MASICIAPADLTNRKKGGIYENLLHKTAAFFANFTSNALQKIKIKYGCAQPYFIFRNRNMN
ncbi:MAG: hypothetical protein DBY39_02540 [Clostridiales bacterium]|nr:MAG: hypothetical protein DBY39_02540 [Clostridiales bacterium]